MTRIQVPATEAISEEEEEDVGIAIALEEDDEAMKMEEDEEVMKIVKNLRRSSGKAAQDQEARDQMQFQKTQGRTMQQYSNEDETATLRQGNGDIPTNIKNVSAATRGAKLFSVDILLRIINQVRFEYYLVL